MKRLQQKPQILVKADAPENEILPAISSLSGVIDVEKRTARTGDGEFYAVSTEEGAFLMNDLARCICDRGWKLHEIRPVDMTLEEIFIQLVTDEERVKQQ